MSDLNFSRTMERLEDRILFDAVPDGGFLVQPENEPMMAQQEVVESNDSIHNSRELLLVDGNLDDANDIVNQILEGRNDRSFEVRILESGEDGIVQISRILESSGAQYDAIHIVSHGSDGQMQLGATSLTSDSLFAYAGQIASWTDNLSTDADLMLYGCNLAQSDQGLEFIEALSEMTGADVAASDDLTGSADLGGDWNLEVATGAIETEALAAPFYRSVLSPPTVDLDGGIAGVDYQATIQRDGNPVNITDADVSISAVNTEKLSNIIIGVTGVEDATKEVITFNGDSNSSVAVSLAQPSNDNKLRSGDVVFDINFDGLNFIISNETGEGFSTTTAENLLANITFQTTGSVSADRVFEFGVTDTARQSSLVATTTVSSDADGDGVIDAKDIDDDNDGILDTAETTVATGAITSWVDQIGTAITPEGNKLSFSYSDTDPASWNSNSVNSLAFSDLGYQDSFEAGFTVDQARVGYVMMGLNEVGTESTARYTDIDNAIYLAGTNTYVYENGTYRGNFGAFAAGDTFSIAVDGSTVNYQKNGTTFYSSTTVAGKDYYLDSSMYNHSASADYSLSNFTLTNLDGSVASQSDQDSDGVSNQFDRDSDNDGISDLMESGSGGVALDMNQDGSLDLTEAIDSDGDGLMDVFENGNLSANTGTQARDFDNDGIQDVNDLDSDNDGISDNVEAQTTAGYTAPTGDVDANGVDRAGLHSLVDTDRDGVTDQLDTDSDGDGTLDKDESGLRLNGTDTNADGIDDGTGVTYADQNGIGNGPSSTLANAFGDTSEVAYRETSDSDGDGIGDMQDIDDDNDGILDSDEGYGSDPPNMLPVDGTFESLANVASSDGYNSNVTSGGWFNGQGSADSWINVTTEGSGTWGGLADGMPASPNGGVFAAAGNWTTGGESFYTDISNLNVGQQYEITFYQANAGIDGTTPIGEMTGWRVNFGTEEQFTDKMDYKGESNQVWEEVTLTFTATSTSQRLEFFCDDDGDATNAGRSTEFMAVDDIRVQEATSTIYTRDTDGDGIDDHLDHDSDNDGISDIAESGGVLASLDTNNDGTVSVAEAEAVLGTNNADADGDGLLDVFDKNISDTSEAASKGTGLVDTDGDGIANAVDLDSDADGISDNIEAQTTTGYEESIGPYNENGVDFAGLSTPVDTDGDGTADYLDSDSDNDGKLDVNESGISLSGNDSNKDGIDDATGVSFADQNGITDNPSFMLANEVGDISEVAYRELSDVDGDGVADGADIDDDNDGILDVNETSVSDGSISTWINNVGTAITPQGDKLNFTYSADDAATWGSNSIHSQNFSELGFNNSFELGFTVDQDRVGYVMMGINEAGTESTTRFTDIDNAIYLAGTTTYVYENGTFRGNFGAFAAGDVFSIAVEGSTVNYQKNGTTFLTSSTVAGKDYYVDSSIYNHSGSADYSLSNFTLTNADGSVNNNSDQDSDGVLNHVDRDSDNDGVSDLVESGNAAGIAMDRNNDGSLDLSEAVDSDGDGLMDVFEDANLSNNTGTQARDTDADGIQDFKDLDSDNDGISDNIESQTTAGYFAPMGTIDANGVDIAGLQTGVDTDSDGVMDHLDTDSDNDGISDKDESGLTFSGTDNDRSGIDDATGVSYFDQNGVGDGPSMSLANEFGDSQEVAYRETPDGIVSGTSGNDTIDRSYSGDADGDQINKDNLNDIIEAGAGNDTVYSGAGNDKITLGTGDDVVVVESGTGTDTTTDFVLHQDLLDVSNLVNDFGEPITTSDVSVSNDGNGNALIKIGQNEAVILQGYSPDDVDNDFLVAAGIPDGNEAVDTKDDEVSVEVDRTVSISVTDNDFDAEGEKIRVAMVNGAAISIGDSVKLDNGVTLTLSNAGTFKVDAAGASVGSLEVAISVADASGRMSDSKLTLNVEANPGGTVVQANDDEFIVTTNDDVSQGTLLGNDVDADGDFIEVVEVNGQSITGPVTLDSGAIVVMQSNGLFDYQQNGAFDGLDLGETAIEQFTYRVADSDGSAVATVSLEIHAVLPTFPDNGNTYQVHSSVGQVATVDTVNNTLIPTEYSAGVSLNAVGLNTNDMYAYGLNQTNKTLAQIGSNGQYVDLGPIEGMPSPDKGAYVGDFGGDGLLYVRPSSDFSGLYGIDVTTQKVVNVIELSSQLNKVYDITWNTQDELFYTVRRGGSGSDDLLLSIDTDGNIKTVGETGFGPNTFGAMFSDANGCVYGISNQSGAVFQFDTTTGAATIVAQASSSNVNDGFSNPNQVIELPPLAQNDEFVVNAAGNANGSVFADNGNGIDIDGNGDEFSVTAVAGTQSNVGNVIQLDSGALVTINADGTVSYDSNGAFDYLGNGEKATDTVTYTITDTTGLSSQAIVSFTQTGVNEAPVAEDDKFATVATGTVNGDLHVDNGAGVDSDVDGDDIKLVLVNGQEVEFRTPFQLESKALLTFYEDGTFIYDPNGQYNQLESGKSIDETFEYTISDGKGGTDTATATVTVYGVCIKDVNTMTVEGLSNFGVSKADQKVINVGDINGNGFDDYAVAASTANGARGMTFLIYGTEDGLDQTFNVNRLLAANGGDGSLGSVFYGIDANDLSGSALSSAGDLNGDGVGDFMIGARDADANGLLNSGETYVIFGSTNGFDAEVQLSSLLSQNGGDGSMGFVAKGISLYDLSGSFLTDLGDVNGDGKDDIAIGAFAADVNGVRNVGQSYVIFGADQFESEVELKDLLSGAGTDGSLGFAISGTAKHDLTGRYIESGDVNNDGINDILITSDNADVNSLGDAGQTYVIYGSENLGGEFELASLMEANGGDGSLGFVFNGTSKKAADGGSVRMIHDANGDGLNDFVASVKNADGTFTCKLILNSSNIGPEVELVDLRNNEVYLDNFDTSDENFDDRDWDKYVYSATLHSSEGTQVTIWGDPHVVIVVDGVEERFDIGYGKGAIELSGGITINWDTHEKDPNVFNGEPPLIMFGIDAPGSDNDIKVDINDGNNAADMPTVLTESQLREFAEELRKYKGDRGEELKYIG